MSDKPQAHDFRGSLWYRWDPHIHAPGTLLSDAYCGDDEPFLKGVEQSSPRVVALGVTDYFTIRSYQKIRRQRETLGRLPDVGLLFPNIEMRLDIKTAKDRAINLHLLFSPHDPEHEGQIERIMGQLRFAFGASESEYGCTVPELIRLGRAFDPTVKNDEAALRVGANQFKVTLKDVKDLFRREEWMRKNCLVAVAGNSNDGTSGVQEDDSFKAWRQETERFANIIFSATPKQREYWLGRLPSADRETIERKYGRLKPCLHGSDAHREEDVARPAMDRYCWIKGDLCFETLRQAIIEPETRVCIGPEPPTASLPSFTISSVRPGNAPWINLQDPELPLNAGLVAVIGARGSGKTALVDMIAAGANAADVPPSDSSFLKRASSPIDHLERASVSLQWGSGDKSTRLLADAAVDNDPFEPQGVRYLSQQFVERLCSSGGLATELRREMERVVFEATDSTHRFDADSFEELAGILLDPIRAERQSYREAIRNAATRIVTEDILRQKLPSLEKEAGALAKKIEGARKDQAALLPKDKEVHARALQAIDRALAAAENRVEVLRKRLKHLDDLRGHISLVQTTTEPQRARLVRERFADVGFSDQDWARFNMRFSGDIDEVIERYRGVIDTQIAACANAEPGKAYPSTVPHEGLPVAVLRQRRDAASKLVGVDHDRQKKYDDLQKLIAKDEQALARLQHQIEHAKGADKRRTELLQERRTVYLSVFNTITQEEDALRALYSPLKESLVDSTGALSKLQYSVRRRVDLAAWIAKGEKLFDLRRDSSFRHGGLLGIAKTELLPFWSRGSAEDVANAMTQFVTRHRDDLLVKAKPQDIQPDEDREWVQRVADWLYGTDHITVEYGIEYDGVAVEQLSPGTRGIVLLLLYLVVDRQDSRPLLVDQPEENLDPHSVFEELVPHFREARRRRQVIIVTHNANLVVNTDADQVIVAESRQTGTGGLPEISYRSGSIENPEIRASVCRILEGGERAFLERERRYRLHWGEILAAPESDAAPAERSRSAGS